MPKLSIITVNLNNVEGLKKTMQSVFEQTFIDYEYIIVDGGSSDGSREYIAQHADKLAYWVSEKDGGMYEGMNKGILRANGNYLMFLNSGDYLSEKHVLTNTSQIINENEPADIYYGDIEIQRGGENILIKHPKFLKIEYLAYRTINHQAAYIKKSLFCQFGLYDLRYRMAADHAFFLKALVNGASFHHISYEMIFYDMNGISSKNWERYKDEMETARQVEIPAEFNKMKEELLRYRQLMNQRIIKYAVRINKHYQRIRVGLK